MPSQSYRQPLWKALFLVPAGVALHLLLVLIWRRPGSRSRALIQHGDHILLVSNITSPWHWTLPGGGYEGSETAAECAAREVSEELGLVIAPNAYERADQQSEVAHGTTWHYDCVRTVVERRPPLKLSLEIYRAAWFPLNDLPVNSSSYIESLLVPTTEEQ